MLITRAKKLHCVKVSVFGVFLFRIQSECEKIWTQKTPNTTTFYSVPILNVWQGSEYTSGLFNKLVPAYEQIT